MRIPKHPSLVGWFSRAGLTLLESLVALSILASLLAIVVIVVPRFGHGNARQLAARTQIAELGVALRNFKTDNGYYPRGKHGLTDLLVQPRDAPNWRGPYLRQPEIPLDPWGNAYIYECQGQRDVKGYDLMSMGPDGRVGSKDDITNW